MLKTFRKSGSNPIVWGILAILIVGLIGFGGRVSSGVGASGIAKVGDQTITTDEFVRALQSELQAMSQQFGQQITMEQARAFGIDGMVMGRLVTTAALDSKSAEFGVSAGDAAVRENLMRTGAFQGADGKFSADAYGFALDQSNVSASEYEESVRQSVARGLVRSGIAGGTVMPASAVAALLAYSDETRSFDWLTLTAASLPAPVAAPTGAEAQAYHAAHSEGFMSPETREITYLSLQPADMAGQVAVEEEQVRAAYEDRIDEFEQPETRAVERLAFASDADAATALARLAAGDVTFEALVAERELQIADLDLGIIARKTLDPEAQATVFDPAEPGIYGPATTLLSPALFRVNAIFPPKSTPYDDVAAALKAEVALAGASALVGEEAVRLDDLLAEGASFEEIDAETAFSLGTVSWHAALAEGITADPAFAADAAAAIEGEDRDPFDLTGGGIAVLRLTAITAPAALPYAEVAAQATAALKAERESEALATYAAELQAQVTATKPLSALAAEKSLALRPVQPQLRNATLPDAPADLLEKLFALNNLETGLLANPGRADVFQLTAINAFDAAAAANKARVADANRQLSQAAGEDLFAAFAGAAQQEAGVSVNEPLVRSLLDRFQ